MPAGLPNDLVEVFRCTDEAVAQMAIDEVLEPAGIPAYVHNRSSHAFPAPASIAGGFFVAVPRSKAAEAREALREAQSGGALSTDGDVTD
jgi:hypothetical protein